MHFLNLLVTFALLIKLDTANVIILQQLFLHTLHSHYVDMRSGTLLTIRCCLIAMLTMMGTMTGNMCMILILVGFLVILYYY